MLCVCVGVLDCQSEKSQVLHMSDCSNFLSLFPFPSDSMVRFCALPELASRHAILLSL